MEKMTKKCSKCGEIKSIDEFYTDKRRNDGLQSQCKRCMNHVCDEVNPEQTEKCCVKCNETKPIINFRKKCHASDGFDSWCKECRKILIYEVDTEQTEKQCTKCNIIKPVEEFSKDTHHKSGLFSWCKECQHKYKSNPEIKKRTNANDKKRRNERIKIDPVYKLNRNTRGTVRKSITERGYTKKSRAYKILGIDDVKLSNILFTEAKRKYPWFTPEDYLIPNKYNLDHIIPLATAKTEEDVIKLNHYLNLQILTKEDNEDKGTLLPSEWIFERDSITLKRMKNKEK